VKTAKENTPPGGATEVTIKSGEMKNIFMK
jgi:hypothetical protein